jgi:hypothetical protein
MATGTFKWYSQVFSAAFNKEIDLVGTPDTMKAMHASTSHVVDQDNHNYKNDITNEVTGTNVPAGGFTCDNVSFGYTAGTNTWKLDHDDESIAAATATGIDSTHWYIDTAGADSTDPLVGFVEWDTALSPSGGTLAFTVNANGLGTIVVS